jgi:glyceraldehyde 3-phosphate dehydrogenase
MKTRVAINGFGRIGRNAFRVAFDRTDVEIVGLNDLTDTKTLAYLLKHDTSYGNYHHEVGFDEHSIIVEGKHIPVFAEKDPTALPWGHIKADVVIESTGRFTTGEAARAHIQAGAKRVVISAPAKGDDVKTVVIGANEDQLEHAGEILSNASCTTNSVAAIMDIMDREFGVEKAMLTTVHSYTASQVLQDGPAKDLREGRAAAENIVPTTTGAAIAVALTVPNLQGKFDGLSVRVPTPVVSLSDVTMVLKRDVSKDEINDLFKRIEKEPYYQGIIGTTEEPLVSKDFVGNSHSGVVDLSLTNVVAGNLAKVVVWYDNEWGYSNRLVELVADLGRMLHGTGQAHHHEEHHAEHHHHEG